MLIKPSFPRQVSPSVMFSCRNLSFVSCINFMDFYCAKHTGKNVFRDFGFLFEWPRILLPCSYCFCLYHRSGLIPRTHPPLFLLIFSWKKNSSQEKQTHARREGVTGSFSIHSWNYQMRKRKRWHNSTYNLARKENNCISSLCSMLWVEC